MWKATQPIGQIDKHVGLHELIVYPLEHRTKVCAASAETAEFLDTVEVCHVHDLIGTMDFSISP